MDIRTVDSPEGLAACRAIRREVFIDEQGVSEEEEWDGLDEQCIHVIALPAADSPWRDAVGCARLLLCDGGIGKAQRVAVRATSRGTGVGRLLMEALHTQAQQHGCVDVVLGAQIQAIPFYLALGYVAEGDAFMDAGIPHRMMRRRLVSRPQYKP